MICIDQNEIKQWAGKNLPQANDGVYIGTKVNGQIKAAVLYCGFYGKSCMIHVHGEGQHWANKTFLKTVFDLPFNKWKLKVIIGTVAGNNEKALKLDRHLGFRDVATIPDAHDEGDLVILEMRPEYCKWAKEN